MKKQSMKLSDKENKGRTHGSHGGGQKTPGQLKKGPKAPQIRYVGDVKLF